MASANLVNLFQQGFDVLEALGITAFYETRAENDGDGNVIYLAYSPIPNANTSDAVWFILKFVYDGSGFFVRRQLPDDGIKFTYSYDQRVTYFS